MHAADQVEIRISVAPLSAAVIRIYKVLDQLEASMVRSENRKQALLCCVQGAGGG